MESESGNFNTNMCEFTGMSGEKTMVRDHLVQPARSTDEEIKTQRKRRISLRLPVHQGLLFACFPHLPISVIFLCHHLPCQNGSEGYRLGDAGRADLGGTERPHFPPTVGIAGHFLGHTVRRSGNQEQSSQPVSCDQLSLSLHASLWPLRSQM